MTAWRDIKDGAGMTLYAILAGVAALVVVLVLAVMWTFGLGFFSIQTANFRGRVSATNQINANGAYRIAAYNHFFDLCASVQNAEATIVAQQQELAGGVTDERKTQIRANITAARIIRATGINQYNADAAKAGTAGQFRASSLPYKLYITTKETQCTI